MHTSSAQRRFRHFLALLLTLTCFTALPAHAWDAVVLDIHDGDTITVAPKSAKEPEHASLRVRLYGIDAPESHQPGGEASTKNLQSYIKPGDSVEVTPMSKDRYDRPLGLIVFEGIILNREQVSTGHAWVYDRYCRARLCSDWKKAEKEARDTNRGLWQEQAPVPPWKWRQ